MYVVLGSREARIGVDLDTGRNVIINENITVHATGRINELYVVFPGQGPILVDEAMYEELAKRGVEVIERVYSQDENGSSWKSRKSETGGL